MNRPTILSGDELHAAIQTWLDDCGVDGSIPVPMPEAVETAIYADRLLFAAFAAGRVVATRNIRKAREAVQAAMGEQ